MWCIQTLIKLWPCNSTWIVALLKAAQQWTITSDFHRLKCRLSDKTRHCHNTIAGNMTLLHAMPSGRCGGIFVLVGCNSAERHCIILSAGPNIFIAWGGANIKAYSLEDECNEMFFGSKLNCTNDQIFLRRLRSPHPAWPSQTRS